MLRIIPSREFLRKIEKLVLDNSPTVLTAIGVAGTLTTSYLTGLAAFRSAQRMGKEKSPTLKESVKICWKLYIPAAAVATVTVAAIVGANRVGTRRAAALAAAYTVTEKAFTEYREKVVERLGESKEQKIHDEIAQDRVRVSESVLVLGEVGLCYEVFTDRYFKGDIESLRRAENELNRTILHDGYASLSDFYHIVGLRPTPMSDEVGWTNDKTLDLRFSAVLSNDNRPCLAITYQVAPFRNYHRFG